jgi:hypothetical protein
MLPGEHRVEETNEARDGALTSEQPHRSLRRGSQPGAAIDFGRRKETEVTHEAAFRAHPLIERSDVNIAAVFPKQLAAGSARWSDCCGVGHDRISKSCASLNALHKATRSACTLSLQDALSMLEPVKTRPSFVSSAAPTLNLNI